MRNPFKNLNNFFCLLSLFFLLTSCQQKPTSVLEESVNIFEPRGVIMDTRSALEFNSFHIPGSLNLLVDDFLILQNPMASSKNQKRIFDKNLNSVIERLAKRGISPQKKVYLIGSKKDSIENKKWQWLLNNLDVKEVELTTLDYFQKTKARRFSEPQPENIWPLKLSSDLIQEFIINKSKKCFAKSYGKKEKWDNKFCQ